MPENTHQFALGGFTCTVINDGATTRPAENLFPSVLKGEREATLLQAGYDPHALTTSYNMLLVQDGDRNVLIDTGQGHEVVPGAGRLRESLRAVGVPPEDVTTIVITHGHPDHVGGLTFLEDRLAFPNARYFMNRQEWQYWGTDAALGTMERERREFYISTLQWIEGVVELFEGERELVPGITALPAPGHTVGHTALLIESEGERLLHIADAAHHPIQLDRPDWSPVFDYDGRQSARTRRELFRRAVEDDLLVLAFHFAFPALGRVRRTRFEYAWEPVAV